MTYSTQEFSGVAQLQSLLPRWEELQAGTPRPHQDLNSALSRIRSGDQGCEPLRVVGVSLDEQLVGLAPLIKERTNLHGWRLRLPGKDVMLARFGMRQATFCGDLLLAPPDIDAQRALLRGVVDSCRDCHLIVFRNVDCNSALHNLLNEEHWRPTWWRWKPREPWSHWLVRIQGDYDAYLKSQFSPRRRHELRREHRRLTEACSQGLRLRIVTSADEVAAFLRDVGRIVDASWQADRFAGWPSAGKHLRRLQGLAAESRFRGYLLCDGDAPIAYTCGELINGVYSPDKTGYDSKWSQFSPGKHLWCAVIEDLFALGSAGWLDFGLFDLWYKQFFANQQHAEQAVYLLRGHLRPALALGPSIVGRAGLSLASKALRPFGLQASFRRLLYRLSRGRVKRRHEN